jgi:hypothetical protein
VWLGRGYVPATRKFRLRGICFTFFPNLLNNEPLHFLDINLKMLGDLKEAPACVEHQHHGSRIIHNLLPQVPRSPEPGGEKADASAAA